MVFTVQDFQDLVRLLEQRPEWRAELRRLVLTEELLGLPAVVRELAEAQRRTEGEVRALAEAQRRAEERLSGVERRLGGVEQRLGGVEERTGRLEAGQTPLDEGQARLEAGLAALAEAQRMTEEELRTLTRSQAEMRDQLGQLRGNDLERRYRERAGAYFDDLVRRAAPLSSQQLADLLDEAEARGDLTRAERRDVLCADLVDRGRRREDGSELYLVIEVSAGVGPDDVERAARRAVLLGRLQTALPVVAGEWATPEAEALAKVRGVWRVLDGRVLAPSGPAETAPGGAATS